MTSYKIQDSYRYACSPWIQQSSRSQATSFEHSNISGFNLFATVQFRKKGQRNGNGAGERSKVIKSLVNYPFRRIHKVQKMIAAHKQQGLVPRQQGNKNEFKPQFKIKSFKNTLQKPSHVRYFSALDCPMVKVKNFTMDPIQQPITEKQEQEDEYRYQTNANFFTQNFKNRCKLMGRHVKKSSPKHKGEASLLDRLNKLTSETPLNRYKSRAFGSQAKRVTPFSPSKN